MKNRSLKNDDSQLNPIAEIASAGLPDNMEEEAWIAVIHQMESIYTDLLHYQVELEEKNAELENAQRFITSVMSSMSDVLVVCDINGKIQQVNQALVNAIGRGEQELLGTSLIDLFTAEYAIKVNNFSEHIRSEPVMDCELELLDYLQQPVPMAVNCWARFDHNNRLSGLVLTGRPLGELKKAYDDLHITHAELKTTQLQLIQSEKLASLGRLVAGVAHELNNPISIVYGNMYALRRYEKRFQNYIAALHQTANPAEQNKLREDLRIDHMLEDIGPLIDGSMEGAERVNDIVQNLLRFSIPQQQSSSFFNLAKVTQTALQWVLRSSKLAPELIFSIPEDFEICNHEGYVHQILINLIQNAVDAMGDTTQPELHITALREDKDIWLKIRDTGPGIENTDLVKIFDPFFSRKSVGDGTGLGLYISYGLASEQCYGSLEVENHTDGGACFCLKLPVEKTF